MVIMNHLSVEDPEDVFPLLPEAEETATPTPVYHRQQAHKKTSPRDFFLSRSVSAGLTLTFFRCDCSERLQRRLCCLFSLLHRSVNLAFSLVLLVGCYSAILIPAYFPLERPAPPSDDYQQPKDLVWMPVLAIIIDHGFYLYQASVRFFPLSSGAAKPISHPALQSLSAQLVSEPPQAPGLLSRSPGHPCVRAE